jgi:hypothetical protein
LEFLHEELGQVFPPGCLQKSQVRFVDKPVKAFTKDGCEERPPERYNRICKKGEVIARLA